MSKKRSTGKVVREGRLQLWAASATTVVATIPFGTFKLFKIM